MDITHAASKNLANYPAWTDRVQPFVTLLETDRQTFAFSTQLEVNGTFLCVSGYSYSKFVKLTFRPDATTWCTFEENGKLGLNSTVTDDYALVALRHFCKK